MIQSKIFKFKILNFPDHYPLHKKLSLVKQSPIGKTWDTFLVVLSIIACFFYVAETYNCSFDALKVYQTAESIYTQFFLVDFVYHFFAAPNIFLFMTSGWTIVDLLTIVPYFLALVVSTRVNLSVFRVVRILRLVRILRAFRLLAGLDGVQRQLITLTLTMISLVFMGAGVIQIMENDVKMQIDEYRCVHINALTSWEPSCSTSQPVSALGKSCDCSSHNCKSYYSPGDSRGQPSGVKCDRLTFLDAFYFMVVTVATVGYGDISPTTEPSKVVVIIFIIVSLVVIPTEVEHLVSLLSTISVYRKPYTPQAGDFHVIVCGYVSDWKRMEQFFREFLHPDRSKATNPDYNIVILSPLEPSEPLKQLMLLPSLGTHVTYLVGSALSVEDLERARADIASAMIFLCNTEVSSSDAKVDDAATILRTLSVSNFNPNLQCIVQVLKHEERDTLKDSDIDVVLCLDQFRTAIQARNAICPGMATVVENLLHSFGRLKLEKTESKPWLDEYTAGACKETFYIPLPSKFAHAFGYDWTLMAEGIFLQFNVMLLGVCNLDRKDMILNPTRLEMKQLASAPLFFKEYSVAVILSEDETLAQVVAKGMMDDQIIQELTEKIALSEDELPIRGCSKTGRHSSNQPTLRRTQSFFESTAYKESTSQKFKAVLDVSKESNWQVWKSLAGSTERPNVQSKKSKQKRDRTVLRRPSNGGTEDNSSHSTIRDLIRRAKSEGVLPEQLQGAESHPDSMTPQQENSIQIKKEASKSKTPLKSTKFSFQYETADEQEFQRNLPSLMMAENVASGAASSDIANADDFDNHVIVFGCMVNLMDFVRELRRPLLVTRASFHPIVIIDSIKPPQWGEIAAEFQDVHYIRGNILEEDGFEKVNVYDAFSVVMLATRDSVLKVEAEYLDTDPLFAYLKLKKRIPDYVFFTVELTCVSNMQVLDSSVMRLYYTDGFDTAAAAAHAAGADAVSLNLHKNKVHGIFSTQLKADKTKSEFWRRTQHDMTVERKMALIKSITFKTPFSDPKIGLTDPEEGATASAAAGAIAGDTLSSKTFDSELVDRENEWRKRARARAPRNNASFWSIVDTHHTFPMFASGRAYVPAAFDTMLCQTFFAIMAPLLVERLIGGQVYQTFYSIQMPASFVGLKFIDLFRAFMSRNAMILAIYRAPTEANEAILPYAVTCPAPDLLLSAEDKVIVFANPYQLRSSLLVFRDFAPPMRARSSSNGTGNGNGPSNKTGDISSASYEEPCVYWSTSGGGSVGTGSVSVKDRLHSMGSKGASMSNLSTKSDCVYEDGDAESMELDQMEAAEALVSNKAQSPHNQGAGEGSSQSRREATGEGTSITGDTMGAGDERRGLSMAWDVNDGEGLSSSSAAPYTSGAIAASPKMSKDGPQQGGQQGGFVPGPHPGDGSNERASFVGSDQTILSKFDEEEEIQSAQAGATNRKISLPPIQNKPL